MVDPEMAALALTILVTLAIFLLVGFGSPSGRSENRSPNPSSEPRSSGSIPTFGTRKVDAWIAWSQPTELDPR